MLDTITSIIAWADGLCNHVQVSLGTLCLLTVIAMVGYAFTKWAMALVHAIMEYREAGRQCELLLDRIDDMRHQWKKERLMIEAQTRRAADSATMDRFHALPC